jgi:hypothetical protein
LLTWVLYWVDTIMMPPLSLRHIDWGFVHPTSGKKGSTKLVSTVVHSIHLFGGCYNWGTVP